MSDAPTPRARSRAAALFAGMRPSHAWKNVPVLAAPLFGHRLRDGADLTRIGVTLGAFLALSSAGYLVNDVVDAESDRTHPRRRLRPVASGDLSPRGAILAALVLSSLALAAAFSFLPLAATLTLAGYFALTVSYTFAWKRVAALAPTAVAAGFVLRVLGGAFAVRVEPSPWLLGLTAVLSLALAVAKREAEARRAAGTAPRSLVLATDVLLASSAAGYVAYTLWPSTIDLHRTHWLVVTAVPVLLALGRFRGLLRGDATGLSPVEIVARDPILLTIGAAWAGTCALVLAL